MSSKQLEKCPLCARLCMPTDRPIFLEQYTVSARLWRYECLCGNRWANDLQRKHNEIELRRARRRALEERGIA